LEHQEIRFKILYTLYQKHYSEDLGHHQQTNKVIEESNLSSIDKAEIYGDVVYLKDKGLIKGQTFLGYAYPPWITIISYGIDTVENSVGNFIQNVDTANVEQPVKDEIKDISKEDYSTREKIKKVVDSLQKHAALFALVKDITVLWL
jgi:hypothetical protein